VERFLATQPTHDGQDRWIITKVQKFDCFWLFCWTSAQLVEQRRATGWAPGITGNNPIAVRKDDGRCLCGFLLCMPDEFVGYMRRKEYGSHAVPFQRCYPDYRDLG
jgi:hypothetical protein